jgi:hypothetical protein
MPVFQTRSFAVLAISIFALLALATSAGAAVPANDNFANAQVLTPGAAAVSGSTTDSTGEVNEPDDPFQSVWYRVDGTATGVIQFTLCKQGSEVTAKTYMGTSSPTLATLIRYEDRNYFDCDEVARVGVTNGSRAYLQVTDGDAFTVRAEFIATAANDSFASPTVISGSRASFEFDTTNATWEPGEEAVMDHGDYYYDGRSFWYQWTAPASGTVSLTACSPDGGDGRPQVTLYSSAVNFSGLGSLKKAYSGCSYDFNGGAMFWEVVGGTTYKIRVNSPYSEYYYGPGTFDLQFNTLPTNDLIASAIDLGSDASVSTTGTNWTASNTPETGEPGIHNGNQRPASVWFKWTAPNNRTYRIDMCESRNSRADFVIAAFTSSGGGTPTPDQLTSIASGDDNCSNLDNDNRAGWLEINATAGTTYWIGVASYSTGTDHTGPFTLRILDATLQPQTTPVVIGSPFVGQTLTAYSLPWEGSAPIDFSFEWQRCDGENCTSIGGATSQSYTVDADDVGKTLRARITAKNAVTTKVVATAQTAVVDFDTDDDGVGDEADQCPSAENESPKTNGCPLTDLAITGNPTISGSVVIGGSTAAQVGSAQNIILIDTATPAPTASVAWQSCTSPTDAASCETRSSGTSYTITAADGDRHIRARVTWSNGDTSKVVWTDAIGPVPALLDLGVLKLPKKASAKKLVKAKGKFTVKSVKFACPAGGTSCKFSVSVTAKIKKKKVKLASSSFTVKPGATATLTGKLSKKGLAQLKKSKKLKTTLALKGAGGATGSGTIKTFTISK